MFHYDRDLKPRKKSYYAFSKNYPGRRTGTKYAIGESRARHKRERNKNILFGVSLVVLFAVVFCVVFVALSLSKKPLEQGGETVAVENGNYHAVYMTPDELAGGIAFDLFRQQLEESGANAVLVDFKTADGNLVFPSTVQTAQDIGACTNAVQTAKDTVQTLQASGYAVIFRIYCFEDALAAAYLPGAAVTEADGKTVWLDDSAQNDGSGWLNPYSDTAKLYLLQIVDDAVSFGADVVLLDGVCFPSGRYLGRAVFAGEAQSTFSRNAVLQDFIEQVKKVTGDVPLAVSMSLSAALSGDQTLYGGGIFDTAADYAAVDFRRNDLPESFKMGDVTYRTDMSQEEYINAATSALSARLEENYRTKGILPITDSADDVSFLQNAGIDRYIRIPAETP